MKEAEAARAGDPTAGADGNLDVMIRTREGTVLKIVAQSDGRTESLVLVDGKEELALAYDQLTGKVTPGDRVTLNTTAVSLSLGTGGVHFVTAVWGKERDISGPGHTIKARYTPSQVRVLAAEDEASPHRSHLQDIPDLSGLPVIVGSVHSQVPVIASAIRAVNQRACVAYVMTDGGALPAAFSKMTRSLKELGIVNHVITAGHAFGGDVETVSVHSALAAAYSALRADVVIVAMGPGVVGTGTPLGTTALEQAPILDAVCDLGGLAIPVLRISFADERERHRGISHHSLTVLTRFVHYPLVIPLPVTHVSSHQKVLSDQIKTLSDRGHDVRSIDSLPLYNRAKQLMDRLGITVTTMGRTDADDPLYFQAAAAAARLALDRMDQSG